MTQLDPQSEKALRLPLGVVSPLWLMFAGAAMTGAAFYWARSWYKATNLEALTPLSPPVLASEPEVAVKEAAIIAQPFVEAAEDLVEATTEVIEDVVGTAELAAEDVPVLVEQAAATVALEPDDLTRLTGIGPKLAVALAERGVTRFADIAAWTEDDVTHFDKDLKLMGRVVREAWIAQAGRYAAAVAN